MPIYEFRCDACGKVSEFQMKLADPHPTDCPACTQPQLKKIMSLPSFQLKGGGWYSDAYDGKSNKRPSTTGSEGATPASESGAGSTTSSTPKTESPAPAPAAKPKVE